MLGNRKVEEIRRRNRCQRIFAREGHKIHKVTNSNGLWLGEGESFRVCWLAHQKSQSGGTNLEQSKGKSKQKISARNKQKSGRVRAKRDLDPMRRHKAESAATGLPSIDSSTARRSQKAKKKKLRATRGLSPVPVLCACGRGQWPREGLRAAAVKGEPSPSPASKHMGPTAHACIKCDRGQSDRCDVPTQCSCTMLRACGPDLRSEMSPRWLEFVKERSSFDTVPAGSCQYLILASFRTSIGRTLLGPAPAQASRGASDTLQRNVEPRRHI